MSRLRFGSAITVLVIFVACAFVFPTSADESSAALALSRAEGDAGAAFEAILEAEQVGADVSGLQVRLSEAEQALAEANVAYRLGDFDESVRLADVCSVISGDLRRDAEAVWLAGYEVWYFNLSVRVIGSLVAVGAVGFGVFGVWRVFKRRYYRRVLEMKPEVDSRES